MKKIRSHYIRLANCFVSILVIMEVGEEDFEQIQSTKSAEEFQSLL